MGKLQTFEIIVTNSGGVVNPGNTVRGMVLLENSQPVDAKEIRMECRGMGHVLWTDGSGSSAQELTNPSYVDHHASEEEYVAANTRLWSGLLPKGSHNLRFEFYIPEGVPSSFDGEFGYVRYWLKASIDRSWRTDSNTRQFTVLAKHDLNTTAGANEEVEVCDNMKVSALFSPGGTCHAALRLDRRGFVPGEIIPLTYIIRNDSARVIQKVWLELLEVNEYHAGGEDKQTERILLKHKLDPVPARTTVEKKEDSLRLPACPPDHLRGCHLIHVYHQVVLKVKPSAIFFKRLKLSVDLIVGSIPLREGSLMTAVAPARRLVGLHRLPLEQATTSTFLWKSMPPPSYTEALSRSPSPSSSPETERRHSLRHHDLVNTLPPPYTPPRPRASTNSSLLRARGR